MEVCDHRSWGKWKMVIELKLYQLVVSYRFSQMY
jgi:hypothetical protein